LTTKTIGVVTAAFAVCAYGGLGNRQENAMGICRQIIVVLPARTVSTPLRAQPQRRIPDLIDTVQPELDFAGWFGATVAVHENLATIGSGSAASQEDSL
jgi:hypothetical protein